MKRITVALKDLKPNPFKKDIAGGDIDPHIVARIKESASKTSFWEQWVVRENPKGEYELAFGHHRLVAAIELYGENHEVSVQLEDYDDEQMFVAMADENAGPGHDYLERCDVVRIARERLLEDPTRCKLNEVSDAGRPKPNGGRPHEHGSTSCVSAYLGETNWSSTTVKELLRLEDNFEKSLLSLVEPENGLGDSGKELIRHKDALTIAQLEKPAQKVAVDILKTANKKRSLPAIWEVSSAVRLAKEDAVRKAEPEQRRAVEATVADQLYHEVPKEKRSAVARTIVDGINSAPTPRKKREAVARVLENESLPAEKSQINKIMASASKPLAEAQSETVRYGLERRVEEASNAKLPSADDEALRIVERLSNLLSDAIPEEKMQTLIAGRVHLTPWIRHGLMKFLDKTGNRFRGYAEELAKPCPNLLTEGAQTPASNTTDSAEAAA